MIARIERVDGFDLDLPLNRPYHWSQGRLDGFRAQIVRIWMDGRVGLGECTTVPGYSWEGPTDSWEFIRAQAGVIVGMRAATACKYLHSYAHRLPFACTALMTAIEQCAGYSPSRSLESSVRMPLVGTVNVDELFEVPSVVERLLATGYRTLKVKVGFGLEQDVAKARIVQEVVGDRASLRFDANQSYRFEAAHAFVTSIDPGNVELVEQPFAPGAWEEMAQLAKISPVPLMLDESIYSLADIRHASRLRCAQFIKLKLMKAGSAADLYAAIEFAQEEGFRVVLGNGAAADVGCYQEAVIGAMAGIDTAGEMNGFLKVNRGILSPPIECAGGDLVVESAFRAELDEEALAGCTTDSFTVEAAMAGYASG